MDKVNCHFGGYATRNDLLCADGRTIRKDAFKDCDGQTVPLVWNHDHKNNDAVLGHALLENREDGVYAYCQFNDTDSGVNAKKLVEHGDVRSLSIYANKLKQVGNDVIHGVIRELSLVLAGANPGAYIDFVMAHDEDGEEGFYASYDESALVVYHSSEKSEEKKEEPSEEKKDDGGKTVAQVINDMTDEQKTAMAYVVGMALKEDNPEDKVEHSEEEIVEHSEGGNDTMKKNVFDQETQQEKDVLSHSAQMDIIELAKRNNVGSLQTAMQMYAESNDTLQHGFEDIEQLFPDYKDVRPGIPETLERDQSWVGHVMRGTHKSPISRVRTRTFDARGEENRAFGYKGKGTEKKVSGNIKLMKRTTDPQTVYRKDEMHRDDIIDITDFDVVSYQWGIMRRNLEEEIARAILIGDGRDEGDEMKISEEHIRSIWHDDDLYTIHADVDIEAARKELQGTETNAHFGENYIYAEAIITAALYSREQYKGSGSLEFYCTPHLLNVMLLARDLNGRRIYSSKADLAAALNVTAIHTVEQFEGLTRTDKSGKQKKLLGLFVNLNDYQIGATKGGEITKFDQFDIDFNQYKYLIETRISGALTRLWSAIALEEPVATTGA